MRRFLLMLACVTVAGCATVPPQPPPGPPEAELFGPTDGM